MFGFKVLVPIACRASPVIWTCPLGHFAVVLGYLMNACRLKGGDGPLFHLATLLLSQDMPHNGVPEVRKLHDSLVTNALLNVVTVLGKHPRKGSIRKRRTDVLSQ
jgi:hypothetical protein